MWLCMFGEVGVQGGVFPSVFVLRVFVLRLELCKTCLWVWVQGGVCVNTPLNFCCFCTGLNDVCWIWNSIFLHSLLQIEKCGEFLLSCHNESLYTVCFELLEYFDVPFTNSHCDGLHTSFGRSCHLPPADWCTYSLCIECVVCAWLGCRHLSVCQLTSSRFSCLLFKCVYVCVCEWGGGLCYQ